MTTEQLVAALVSCDASEIIAASHKIIASRDRPLLAGVAGHIRQIETRTVGIDLGGMLRPNASYLDFAIGKLRFAAVGQDCFCKLYPHYDLFLPRAEEKSGHVIILDEKIDRAEWSTLYRCRCVDCEQAFRAEQQDGYHYPWAKWTVEG
ncbi:MAG: hypothetical protein ACRCSU_07485 [Paracoccaceae bacterium]